ncbi:MAG: SpoIIE family protein phosphatase [Chloroflexota bacterium]
MKRKSPTEPHLLIVDDSEKNRNELVHHLSGQGYKLTVVEDGQAALDILPTKTFDLVLLAINIPKVSGYDVLTYMKSSPDLQQIPVLMISSVANSESIVRCIELGADDYIREPYNAQLLDTRIKSSIHKYHIQEERVRQLREVSERINRVIAPDDNDVSSSGTNIEAFLQRTLTEIKSMHNADAGTVYIREQDILRFAVVLTDSLGIALGGKSGNPITFPPLQLYDRETKQPNHSNVASYVALSGEVISIPNIYAVENFDFSAARAFDERNNYQTVSCLAVPLKNHKQEVIGVLQLLNAHDAHGHIIPFDPAKLVVTELLCSHVATMLSNYLLIQQQLMMTKIESDIRIGRDIQRAFLPTTYPNVPGWEICTHLQAAREVAGDFYDVFKMSGDRIALIIGDVCDKGVGAALFMSLIRSFLRAFAMQNYKVDWSNMLDTHQISVRKLRNMSAKKMMPSAGMNSLENAIKLTNNYVAVNHAELSMFATTFFGVLDPEKGLLTYINGGHCPPMIIDANGNVKERLQPTGPAVGMFADAEFAIDVVALEPGDTLFAFTDGVTDARNPAGKMFKEAGIMGLLQPPFSSANELLNRAENELRNFMGDAVQFDDITMLGITRKIEPNRQPASGNQELNDLAAAASRYRYCAINFG